MRAAWLGLMSAVLTGCAHQAQQCPAPLPAQKIPYEVKVPVYIERQAPSELMRPYKPLNLPTFLAPGSPDTVVGLDAEGVDRLKILLRTIKTRDDAWRAWATKPQEKTK